MRSKSDVERFPDYATPNTASKGPTVLCNGALVTCKSGICGLKKCEGVGE